MFVLERARPAREGRQATPGTPSSTETFATCVVSCAEARAIAAMPKTAVVSSPNKVTEDAWLRNGSIHGGRHSGNASHLRQAGLVGSKNN